MSFLQSAFRIVIYGMITVLLGILISDVGNRYQDDVPGPEITTSVSKPVVPLSNKPEIVETLVSPSTVTQNKEDPYRERLGRFDGLRSKVLLNDGESSEKQRLLSHLKTVQWIEKELSGTANGSTDAQRDRLTMIDFIEEALSWKDNPIRSDVLDSVERTLEFNNVRPAPKEMKRLLAGDKMELLAILADEDPNRARALLDSTKDKQLAGIFQYAIKRLALWKKLGQEAQ